MDRLAFEIPIPGVGALPVYWYGLSIAVGFGAAYGLTIWRARRRQFPLERVGDLGFWGVIGGIVGARVLYIINYWEQFRQETVAGEVVSLSWLQTIGLMLAVHRGGLVFYGALIGGILAIYIYCRRERQDFLQIADLCAPAVPLAHVFGRIGCFFNGCCYGHFTEGWLAFRYPVPPYGSILNHQVEQGLVTPATEHYLELVDGVPHYCLPLQPVQLLYAGRNLLTFLLLLLLARWLKKRGQLFTMYLMLYAVGRFLHEFWRGDYRAFSWGMTPAQQVCLLMFPPALAAFIWFSRRPLPTPPADAAA